jgi:hypothetical protein
MRAVEFGANKLGVITTGPVPWVGFQLIGVDMQLQNVIETMGFGILTAECKRNNTFWNFNWRM